MAKRKFDVGDKVKIIGGPFRGRKGTVIEIIGIFTKSYALVYPDGLRSTPVAEYNLTLDK